MCRAKGNVYHMKDFFRQFCVSIIQSSLTYSQGLNTTEFLPYVTGTITVLTLKVNFTLTFFFLLLNKECLFQISLQE